MNQYFCRLGIQHNDLEQYFQDYQDFYPSGLHFELAIHVFWRPRQITFRKYGRYRAALHSPAVDNWNNRYSKYLSHQRVFGACGIHPHWSFMWRDSSIEDVERCLRHPKVVALGEIGLDFGPKYESPACSSPNSPVARVGTPVISISNAECLSNS